MWPRPTELAETVTKHSEAFARWPHRRYTAGRNCRRRVDISFRRAISSPVQPSSFGSVVRVRCVAYDTFVAMLPVYLSAVHLQRPATAAVNRPASAGGRVSRSKRQHDMASCRASCVVSIVVQRARSSCLLYGRRPHIKRLTSGGVLCRRLLLGTDDDLTGLFD